MSKKTTFGAIYASAITAGKNPKQRRKACVEYLAAKKIYIDDIPAKKRKYLDAQAELAKSLPERIAARKAKKLAKNKEQLENSKKNQVMLDNIFNSVSGEIQPTQISG
jgi:hypothetical protein